MFPYVFRYAYADRKDSYCYAVVDDKTWRVEIPSRHTLKIAIPSQLGQLLKNVAVDATAHMNATATGNEIDECVSTAVNHFLADWDGMSGLIDITREEEAELRKAHEVVEDYPVASLFRDKLFAMPEVFQEEVALVDSTSEEEDKLREDYNAANSYLITSFFHDNLFEIPNVSREWTPKNVVVLRNISGRFTAIKSKNCEGKDLIGV
ncbi:hypothetical protein E8E14_013073 [Neopestalotiopsis sp. 37M]|nr:hypothetical protein E8E14_013073 [Neopestalotiopsis sp. 37M]